LIKQNPVTLIEALERRATSLSDRVAYRFLREGELEQGSITFGDLRRRALAAAARLGALEGGGRGEVAILLYPQGIEFIVAFFGCLYAGVVAVPASISHRKRGMAVLSRIAEDSGARWILSTGTQLEQLSADVADVPGLAHVPCIDIEQGSQRLALSAPCCEPDSIALLQYTSGSTGMPSGVALTHANLADNQQQMQQTFEHDDQTVFVSWLPMFHDMGLGTMLMSVWSGRPCVIMSPSVFVQNPRRWLAAISHYRGTTTLAPDFAYDLCVRRVNSKDREGLDLSCWRVAVNGSEPVRSSTIERFVEAFGPCGFRREAFSPAYGLAEATLFVCAGEARALPMVQCFARENLAHGRAVPASEPAAGSTLVSCGYPRFGTRLLIVDPETREECAPDEIGEVWLRGASVGAGYWNKELETKHTFHATTADGRGPFLRTGDLAFIHDSQLFIAGRHKDIIIVRGRNHSPQDIEDSVSTCHPALVPRRCAAFSIDSDEGEQLVLVQELARPALRTLDATAVYRAIRSVVSANHALQTHAIVLLKPATLPRTTSGKVRRKTCREGFLDNSLPAVASWRAVARGDVAQSESAQGREAAQRADQVIHWVRQSAVELAQSSSQDPRELSAARSGALAKQGLLGMQVETRHDVSKEPTHTLASHSLQRVAGPSRLEGASSRDRDAAKRQLRFRIISWLANRLRIPVSEVEADRSFSDHGLDSVSSVELAKSLSDGLGREVDATVVWSFATIDALADHLLATRAASTEPVPAARPADQGSSSCPRPSSGGGTQLQDELAMLEHELRSRS
jgi:acyl-CoA synthetase (AMP-forming)/AMP-acid ligase II/acyl carrier protein